VVTQTLVEVLAAVDGLHVLRDPVCVLLLLAQYTRPDVGVASLLLDAHEVDYASVLHDTLNVAQFLLSLLVHLLV